jgi:hypothetical protein
LTKVNGNDEQKACSFIAVLFMGRIKGAKSMALAQILPNTYSYNTSHKQLFELIEVQNARLPIVANTPIKQLKDRQPT